MAYFFSKGDADLQTPEHVHVKAIETLKSKTSIIESHKLLEVGEPKTKN